MRRRSNSGTDFATSRRACRPSTHAIGPQLTGTTSAGRPGADELAAAGAGAENLDENLDENLEDLLTSSKRPLAEDPAFEESPAEAPGLHFCRAPRRSSGNGVKGHQAREAFLKQLENHAEVSQIIRGNACQELGVPAATCPPGLMRKYLEKRMALGDHRNLAYFSTFLAYGWQEARESQNVQLKSFCARGLMALEQMARQDISLEFATKLHVSTIGPMWTSIPISSLNGRCVWKMPLASFGQKSSRFCGKSSTSSTPRSLAAPQRKKASEEQG